MDGGRESSRDSLSLPPRYATNQHSNKLLQLASFSASSSSSCLLLLLLHHWGGNEIISAADRMENGYDPSRVEKGPKGEYQPEEYEFLVLF